MQKGNQNWQGLDRKSLAEEEKMSTGKSPKCGMPIAEFGMKNRG
jgi:hypothetical protein